MLVSTGQKDAPDAIVQSADLLPTSGKSFALSCSLSEQVSMQSQLPLPYHRLEHFGMAEAAWTSCWELTGSSMPGLSMHRQNCECFILNVHAEWSMINIGALTILPVI